MLSEDAASKTKTKCKVSKTSVMKAFSVLKRNRLEIKICWNKMSHKKKLSLKEKKATVNTYP